MNRKHLTMSALIALALLTIAFTPISSQQGVHDYDPWVDLNDDGKIDGRDIAGVSARFATLGTPINKTALLLELQSKVAELETKVNILNATKLGTPDYDSGWMPISLGETKILNHNLGTTNVLAYVIGKDDAYGTIHQWQFGTSYGEIRGAAWWGLTSNEIKVTRGSGDDSSSIWGKWNEVRVMLWIIP